MIKGLLKDNIISMFAPEIKFGEWDEPDIQKWALFDENNNIMYYALDDGYELITFEESDIPSDYVPGKYFYIDNSFIENPDYKEPPLPTDKRLDNLELTSELLNDILLELLLK